MAYYGPMDPTAIGLETCLPPVALFAQPGSEAENCEWGESEIQGQDH